MGLSASAVADLSLEELRCAKFQVLFRVCFKEPVVVFSGLNKHLYEYLFSYRDCSDCEIAADKSLFLTHVTA